MARTSTAGSFSAVQTVSMGAFSVAPPVTFIARSPPVRPADPKNQPRHRFSHPTPHRRRPSVTNAPAPSQSHHPLSHHPLAPPPLAARPLAARPPLPPLASPHLASAIHGGPVTSDY